MTTDTPHAQVASAMPGRLRIKLDRGHRRNGALDQVHEGLEGRVGIQAVASNPMTGSVLVRYDRDALDHDGVLAMLRDAGIVVGGVARSVLGGDADFGQSIVSTNILDALNDLDRRLSRATNGLIDVKLLFPVMLGTLAIRQIAINGLGLGTVPGYVLLWYTFDSFYKLHPRAQPAFTHDPDVQAAQAAMSDAVAADADARAARDEAEATGDEKSARTARAAATRADRAAARVGDAASATRRAPGAA
jgi:hypothetical protein